MNTFNSNNVSANQTWNQKPGIVSGTGMHGEYRCVSVNTVKGKTVGITTGSILFARTSLRYAKRTLEVSHGKALFLPCY